MLRVLYHKLDYLLIQELPKVDCTVRSHSLSAARTIPKVELGLGLLLALSRTFDVNLIRKMNHGINLQAVQGSHSN